jgi:hypothetical protein
MSNWIKISRRAIPARVVAAFRANLLAARSAANFIVRLLPQCAFVLNKRTYIQIGCAWEENEWGDLDNQSYTSSCYGTRNMHFWHLIGIILFPLCVSMIYLRLVVSQLAKVMAAV